MLDFVLDTWSQFLSVFSAEWYLILAITVFIAIIHLIKEVIYCV